VEALAAHAVSSGTAPTWPPAVSATGLVRSIDRGASGGDIFRDPFDDPEEGPSAPPPRLVLLAIGDEDEPGVAAARRADVATRDIVHPVERWRGRAASHRCCARVVLASAFVVASSTWAGIAHDRAGLTVSARSYTQEQTKRSPSVVELLETTRVRPYAWGRSTVIAERAASMCPGPPAAETVVSARTPDDPSRLVRRRRTSAARRAARRPARLLGEDRAARWDGTLPFLLRCWRRERCRLQAHRS
jgi:hypothetical protein